jgi:hypothetical protein
MTIPAIAADCGAAEASTRRARAHGVLTPLPTSGAAAENGVTRGRAPLPVTDADMLRTVLLPHPDSRSSASPLARATGCAAR